MLHHYSNILGNLVDFQRLSFVTSSKQNVITCDRDKLLALTFLKFFYGYPRTQSHSFLSCLNVNFLAK